MSESDIESPAHLAGDRLRQWINDNPWYEFIAIDYEMGSIRKYDYWGDVAVYYVNESGILYQENLLDTQKK